MRRKKGPKDTAHDCSSSRRQTTFFPASRWDEQSCAASFKTQMGQLPTAGHTAGRLARPVWRPTSCVSMQARIPVWLAICRLGQKIRDPVSYGTWGRLALGCSLLLDCLQGQVPHGTSCKGEGRGGIGWTRAGLLSQPEHQAYKSPCLHQPASPASLSAHFRFRAMGVAAVVTVLMLAGPPLCIPAPTAAGD